MILLIICRLNTFTIFFNHCLCNSFSFPFLSSFLFEFLQGASASSSRLAASIIQNCTKELEPLVFEFLTSCILDRDAVGSKLKEYYHEILFEIFQCAPQMLLEVIPKLTQELLVGLTSSFHMFW